MIPTHYYTFVLGYDLLHDALNGIDCDVAYDFCVALYNDFEDSAYNDSCYSEYVCLSMYVNDHMDEIKARLEELK